MRNGFTSCLTMFGVKVVRSGLTLGMRSFTAFRRCRLRMDFDIFWTLLDQGETLDVMIGYDNTLYHHETIQTLVEHYTHMLHLLVREDLSQPLQIVTSATEEKQRMTIAASFTVDL